MKNLTLLLAIILAIVQAVGAEPAILDQAKAEKDPAAAIALYWKYFETASGDTNFAAAADKFAGLLSEQTRNADLVRFGETLMGQERALPSPLNTVAYALAENDTALDRALELAKAAVDAQRELRNSPTPPDRSAKAWSERNQMRLAYYLDTYGYVWLKKHDGKRALEALQEANNLLSLEPDPEICRHLSLAYRLTGQVQQALDWAVRASYYLGKGASTEMQHEMQIQIQDCYQMVYGSLAGVEDYVSKRLNQLKDEEYGRLVGDKLNYTAPDFNLKALDGATVKLSDFHGKIVLVDFWATWCGPCKRELPLLQEAYAGWKEKGVIFLAISTDKEAEKVAPFIAENHYTFPVLYNEGTSKAYDVAGIPNLFVVDQSGQVRYQHLGYRPDVVDILNLQIAELQQHP